MAGIVVFQHVRHEPPGLIGEVLAARGHWIEIWRTNRAPLPERLPEECAGLVVMGGPQAVYERERNPWIAAELDLVRQAIQEGLPVLGVCLGSQLVAAAAQARVFPGQAGREIGWDRVELTPEGQADPLCLPLLEGEPAPPVCSVFQWHGDSFDLPAGAVRLAGSSRYPNQAFRIGDCAYALQFHFEVDAGIIATWVERGQDYIRAGGFTPEPILAGCESLLPPLLRRGRRMVEAFASLIESRASASAAAPRALRAT